MSSVIARDICQEHAREVLSNCRRTVISERLAEAIDFLLAEDTKLAEQLYRKQFATLISPWT